MKKEGKKKERMIIERKNKSVKPLKVDLYTKEKNEEENLHDITIIDNNVFGLTTD